MKFIIIASLVALAVAEKADVSPPAYGSLRTPSPIIAILRDDRIQQEDGTYNVEFEAENGIVFKQSGHPEGYEGAVVKSGSYEYYAPDGTHVEVTYVANEDGYQASGDVLPVAPEFPHPIPQFVLDQIARAAEEDAAAARESSTYGAPQ